MHLYSKLAALMGALCLPAPAWAQTSPTIFTAPVEFDQPATDILCPVTNGPPCPNPEAPAQAATIHNFTTSLGAAIAEVGTAFNARLATSNVNSWVANTAYNKGDERSTYDVGGIYVQLNNSCVSGSGSGPTGTGTAIPDGTCLWKYEVNVNAAAKINLGVYTKVPSSITGSNMSWGIYANGPIASTGLASSGAVSATLLKLAGNTVAALPACNGANEGSLAYVRDALSPAYNADLTGGGTSKMLALCNGTSWTAH